jgi:hypothetical protein
MKFVLTTLTILFWGLVPEDSYSQQKLSKEEILTEFRNNRIIPNLDSLFLFETHLKTRAALDDLLKREIDTLLIYSFDFPGLAYFSKNDICSTARPNAYLFWKERGEYFFKATYSLCTLNNTVTDGKILKFAVDKFAKIKDEFFMGAISSGLRKGKNQIQFSQSWVDHEPKYSILVMVHGQYNYLTFTENDLTNQKSLFLDYNKTLTSFALFELIKKVNGKD